MPKFVIDEDMPRSTSKVLKESGYVALDIRDHSLRGAEDHRIYQFSQENQAVLITGDLGFGNLLHFPLGSHCGIIVARFPNEMNTKELNRLLVERIRELTEDDCQGNLIIIEPGKMRIRKK
jgi:predicted nuclease of predicted toxin-antitoxin system